MTNFGFFLIEVFPQNISALEIKNSVNIGTRKQIGVFEIQAR